MMEVTQKRNNPGQTDYDRTMSRRFPVRLELDIVRGQGASGRGGVSPDEGVRAGRQSN